jgi:chloride channel 3/4/5
MAAIRKKYLAKHGVLEAVTLATITAMVGYFNIFLRIDMTESMSILFRECESGGDYNGLCQYVYSRSRCNIQLLKRRVKNSPSMAHDQLSIPGNSYSYLLGDSILWL